MIYASGESPEEYVRRIMSTSREGSPLADQMDSALQPERNPRTGNPLLFTPRWADARPAQAAVDSVREIPTTIPDVHWLRKAGVTWLHSNQPGRQPLPPRYGIGYDLTDEFVGNGPHSEARREALRGIEDEYLLALDAATTGPVMTKSVVVYGESAQWYTPPLVITELDSGESVRMEPSLVAYPVPPQWTSLRVARMLASRATRCFWCARDGDIDSDKNMPFAMLVSAGPLLRVFPACTHCNIKLDRECGYFALDWLILFDGWDRATGWPADEYR